MMLRRIYELSCYDNIAALFNLIPTDVLLIAYFNVDLQQAELTGFGQLRRMIDNSPYFTENYPRDTKVDSVIRFLKSNLMIRYASSENHTIGTQLIGAILDEANFMKGDGAVVSQKASEVRSKAADLYTQIRQRSKSRFIVDEVNWSLSILVSSTMYDSSFTKQREAQVINDPHALMFNEKIWNVKKEGTYSKERFSLFLGNSDLDPFVIETQEDLQPIWDSFGIPRVVGTDIKDEVSKMTDVMKSRIMEIPMTFYQDFHDNLIKSIQNIAGEPVAGEGRLFTSTELFKKALYTPEERCFTKDEIVISTKDKVRLEDYINPNWKPEHPERKRYLHADQGVTDDSYGLAQCYLDDIVVDSYGNLLLYVKYDFILRINPPKPPAKISLIKIRDIIPYFANTYGITYGKITYDTYQSTAIIQELEAQDFNVDYQSVDRTDQAYLDFVDYMYAERVKIPYHRVFETELFNLVHYRQRHKVDHLDIYSKDTSDAVVGALHNLINDPNVDEILSENDLDIILSVLKGD